MVTEKVTTLSPSSDTVGPPLKVAPLNSQSLYYAFTIQAFGWYNIDILLENDNPNTKNKIKGIKPVNSTNISNNCIIL